MLGLGYCASIIVGCQLQGVSQVIPFSCSQLYFSLRARPFLCCFGVKISFLLQHKVDTDGNQVGLLFSQSYFVCLNNNRQSKKLPILYWSLNLHFGVTNFIFEVIILVHRNSKFWQPWTRTLIRSLLKGVITMDIRTQTNPKPTTVHNSMSLQPD